MEKNSEKQASTIKRALHAIDNLQAKLAAVEKKKNEPIAVVGMGCRFPGGADTPASFWELLKEGRHAVGPVPAERWNIDDYYDADPDAPGKMYIRQGAFLDGVDRFDAPFFGISPREAMSMDPQQRLLLEVGWEALEYAGIVPTTLQGSRTGVFVGIGQNDYARLKLTGADATQIDTYDGTGNLLCFAAGRLAYTLGLHGPNMAIDTACSSSLVALHQACLSLRAQECDLALAGGVHLVISPEMTIFLSRARVLSPEGRCKAFDAAADGFVRGEGCGMVVLKRLSAARKAGDKILALIRGSAVNHDGASSGLTVPNEAAQEQLIRRALTQARIDPRQVSYLEAHGTGTALGDPIEINALAAALCKERTADSPLQIGSVKTNIGHLEAAAGIAGVIKVILALQHKELPPHLHFNRPNPHVAWDQIPIRVTARGGEWAVGQTARLAGVSSFGFSGTNAHIILQESIDRETADRPETSPSPHLLALSAKSDDALKALAQRYESHLASQPSSAVGHICYSANTGRSRFAKRLAVIGTTGEELARGLAAFRRGGECAGLYTQGPSGKTEVKSSSEADALVQMADRFIQGAAVSWRAFYRDSGLRKVDVPTYPFQRQRYWAATPEKSLPVNEDTSRSAVETTPPWGRRLHLPFSRQVRFEHRLTAETPAHLADHKLLGAVVVSAATQIVTILGAAAEAFGADAHRLKDVVFAQPLMISDKGVTPVQIIFVPQKREGVVRFRLVSGDSEGFEENDGNWTTHVSGTVLILPADYSRKASALFNVGRWRTTAERVLTGSDFYAARRRSGYQFGPAFQWARRMWRREHQILGEMGSPSKNMASEGYPLHPGLLDACFQMVDACWEAEPYDEHLRVPVKIADLRLYQPSLQGTFWCQAQGKVPSEDDGGKRIGNLRLLNHKGETLVAVEGFELGHARRDAFRARMPDGESIYEINWRPLPALSQPEGSHESPTHAWLLFADGTGVAEDLAAGLRSRGERVFMAARQHRYVDFHSQRYGVNPESPADFERLLEAIDTPLKGVVYLWGLDLGTEISPEAIERSEVVCAGLSFVVSALEESRGGGAPPAVWTITQGALPVEQAPEAPLQAMLWGVNSVFELEHPEYRPRVVDLDARADEARPALLIAELLSPDAETRIALRGGTRHGARLAPKSQGAATELKLEADAGYLVTGGLGALGLEVAHWMARNGARHLSLCGRSLPSSAALEKIARIKQTGCKVLVFTADVSDHRDVNNLLTAVGTRMPPLRGIVHAAGVIDDALLTRQYRLHYRKVMAPKVRGTWHLHSASAELPLDFFICFSSTAAVIGSGGQANYAAANAFMDTLMHVRRSQGLAGLSINWGAWGDIGMASRLSAEIKTRLAAQGLGELIPAEGLALLEKLFSCDAPQAAVMSMEWDAYLRHRFSKQIAPLYEVIAGGWEAPAPADEPTVDAGHWLAELPADQRYASLLEYVRSQVAATLGMTDVNQLELRQRLFDAGIDSLMAVELKNRLEKGLGIKLGATIVFDYPTVAALATHLSRGDLAFLFVKPPKEEAAAASEADEEVASLISEIEAMPDQDLRALFAHEKAKQQETI